MNESKQHTYEVFKDFFETKFDLLVQISNTCHELEMIGNEQRMYEWIMDTSFEGLWNVTLTELKNQRLCNDYSVFLRLPNQQLKDLMAVLEKYRMRLAAGDSFKAAIESVKIEPMKQKHSSLVLGSTFREAIDAAKIEKKDF
jgi:hypothetical protein